MRDYLLWGQPEALRYLWLLPPLALLYVYAARQRARVARAFYGEQTPPRPRLRNLKAALEIAAIGLLIVAVARPQIGAEMRKVTRTGVDVILAIDTSTSMACQDVTPSREEVAKQAALALTARLGGDRVGLIVFADAPYLYSPLTADGEAVTMFLSAVEVGAAPGPGTNLAKAMLLADEMFKAAESRHRVLVLITDGEDHGGAAAATARRLGGDGVIIETIGVGTTQGAPVPQMNLDGLIVGVKHDKRGQNVVSKMGDGLLQDVAKAGHGEMIASSQSGVSVDRLAYAIASAGGSKTGAYEFVRHTERFQYPLAAGLLLLIAAAIAPDTSRRRVVPSADTK